ncbi:hypothetical protein Hanom_Chr14g01334471 [Helianthus anomalus]
MCAACRWIVVELILIKDSLSSQNPLSTWFSTVTSCVSFIFVHMMLRLEKTEIYHIASK